MTRVLLTVPPLDKVRLREDHPMGLVYLGSYLKDCGHEVLVHDSEVEPLHPLEALRRFCPSIVGVSFLTHSRHAAFQLCEEMKRERPDLKIVVGGPHCGSTGRQILCRWGHAIDFVVRGYGESVFAKLIAGEPPETIPGLAFLSDGEVVETPFTGAPSKDDYCLPDYRLLNLSRYKMRTRGRQALPLFTSRGCCNKCIFCAAGFFSQRVGFFPVEMALENIDRIHALGYRAVRIQDDTFGMQRESAYQVLEHLARKKIIYSIKSRVAVLDNELLKALKETSCEGVRFGIESIVPHVLKTINKSLDLVKLERVLNEGLRLGLPLGAYILVGNPGESFEDAQETVAYAQQLMRRGVDISPAFGCYIYPGTELEPVAKEEGLLPVDFDWTGPYSEPRNAILGYDTAVPVYISSALGYQKILDLYNLHFANQGKQKPVASLIKKALPKPVLRKVLQFNRRYLKSSF